METDRYRKAVAESRVNTDRDVVKGKVEKICENAAALASEDVYRFLFSIIDLTTLSTEDSQESVAAFTRRVNDFDEEYPQYPSVASICVYSNFAETVRSSLDVTGVNVDVVAGGFPSGQTFTEIKVADAALAVASGADEVDVVMNLGYLRDGSYEELCDELVEIKHAAKGAIVKVILETGALHSLDEVKAASVLAMWSDADFIKTSTGKIYPGASMESAYVMCSCIKEYYEKTGRKVGFKAAGGIRNAEDALKYYALVKEVLGDEWLDRDYFRIGASGLANSLLAAIAGQDEVRYF